MKRILLTLLAICFTSIFAYGQDFTMTAPFSHIGTTDGKGNTCSYRASEDVIYEITIPCSGVWRFELCDSEETSTPFTTWMYLSKSLCGSGLGINGRHDNRVGCNKMFSRLNRNIDAGVYYLTIEGDKATSKGTYKLDVFKVNSPKVCGDDGGENPGPQACYATEVVSFTQGLRKNNTPVDLDRSVANVALGVPDGADLPGGFVSLGFGGSIVLKFDFPILNGPGNDIKVFETTYSNPCATYPEYAQVFASQDGDAWVYLGTICQDGELDLGVLPNAQYIKILDISNKASSYFPSTADGFDVDGIQCLNGFDNTPTPNIPNNCTAFEVLDFNQQLRSNGTPVEADRSNPLKALGVPEANNSAGSFVSLGFGGSITLKFQFALFDQVGDDLMVYETTFSPWTNNCGTYPENAKIWVSQDNVTYYDAGTICQNGSVDFSGTGLPWIQYVKVEDVSVVAAFAGVGHLTDGYDLDGIVCITPGAAKRLLDSSVLPTKLNAFPNPVQDVFNVTYTGVGLMENVTVNVYNVMGQQVISNNVYRSGDEMFSTWIDMSALKAGVYFVVLTSGDHTEKVKVVKN